MGSSPEHDVRVRCREEECERIWVEHESHCAPCEAEGVGIATLEPASMYVFCATQPKRYCVAQQGPSRHKWGRCCVRPGPHGLMQHHCQHCRKQQCTQLQEIDHLHAVRLRSQKMKCCIRKAWQRLHSAIQ